MAGIIAVVFVFVVLLAAEYIRKTKKFSSEATRKFVHISVGSFVAFWPFFLSHTEIFVICAAFVAVVVGSRYLKMFPAIHRVTRSTWGDVLFPFGIALSLLLAHSPWIFAAGLLHLSFADGMAALVGVKYGRGHIIKIEGYTKTLYGTLTFMVCSFLILAWLIFITPDKTAFNYLGVSSLLWLPVVGTFVEAASTKGTDNITVPITIIMMMNALSLG